MSHRDGRVLRGHQRLGQEHISHAVTLGDLGANPDAASQLAGGEVQVADVEADQLGFSDLP